MLSELLSIIFISSQERKHTCTYTHTWEKEWKRQHQELTYYSIMMNNPQSRFGLHPTGPEPELLMFVALSLHLHPLVNFYGNWNTQAELTLFRPQIGTCSSGNSNSLLLLHVHDDYEGIASVDLGVKICFNFSEQAR